MSSSGSLLSEPSRVISVAVVSVVLVGSGVTLMMAVGARLVEFAWIISKVTSALSVSLPSSTVSVKV